MDKRILFVIIVIITLLSATLGVYLLSQENKTTSSNTKIATSIFPLYDITKNIVGDKFEVIQILPAGASPHTFDPDVETVSEISGATTTFIIGHELDNWAQDIAQSAQNDIEIYTVDKGIELEKGHHHHEEDSDHEDEHEHDEDEHEESIDPHYWLSVTNAKIIAQNITQKVIELDPQNKEFYETNLSNYQNKLDEVRNESINKINSLNNKNIITFHSAFNYFAHDLGLEVIATIEEFPGQEPTIEYIAEVGEVIEHNNIKILFKEPQLSDSVVSALADDYGAQIYTLDPLGGTQNNNSYIDLIEYNVNTVVNAYSQ